MPLIFLSAVAIEPHPLMMLPFVGMLLSIALLPLISTHHWERHYPKIAVTLGAITTFYYVFALGNPGRMLHVAHEYVSFIALVASLFIVAGGIHIQVKGEATPAVNCAFLIAGALLANIIGTTGASIVLIRPWIRINRYRITGFHVVFFIFIVSNIGGCLTPIGDPPLFLGYIKGVPFWWVLKTCWPAWLIAVFGLTSIFYVIDRRNFLRAPAAVREAETHKTWRFEGLPNLAWLACIIAAVFLRSPLGLSEVLMSAAAMGSYIVTPKAIHKANAFDFHPIREIAWLFLGIFATMPPALDYLEVHAKSLGLSSDLAFFWLTGLLSATLDNAPTYLTFLAAAMGTENLNLDSPEHVRSLLAIHSHKLIAISLGAVFFGAMTYIGNGPNFMVKAICERSNVKTPGFFAYLLYYAIPVLLPLFILISILFFSRWHVF